MHSITSRSSDPVATLLGGKALIGVIHCPPFPGTPRDDGRSMQAILDACLQDVDAHIEGGLNGLIVENHGNVPFLKPEAIGPETTGFLSVITDHIVRRLDVPVGVNVLANAPIPAIA